MSNIQQYASLSHFNNFGKVVGSMIKKEIKLCSSNESLQDIYGCHNNILGKQGAPYRSLGRFRGAPFGSFLSLLSLLAEEAW